MFDFNSLLDGSGTGWELTDAIGIHDNEWIAANGTFEGEMFAVLLTQVPEPCPIALLTLGTLGLLFARRRFAQYAIDG